MSYIPLENLHEEFVQAYQNHTYLGPSKTDPHKLEQSVKKEIRMAEVFKIARQQIEETLKNHPQPHDLSQLKALKEDGKMMYEHYLKSTHTWSRQFLKGLASYTPEQLKFLLPACFSNKMEQAEQEAYKQFEEYRSLIRTHVKKLSTKEDAVELLAENENDEPGCFDAERDDVLHPQVKPAPLPLSKKIPPASKEIQELREKRIKALDKSTLAEEEDPELQELLQAIYFSENNKDSADASDDLKKNSPQVVSEKDESSLEEEEEPVKKKDPLSSPLSVHPLSPQDKQQLQQKMIDAQCNEASNLLHSLNQMDQRPLSLNKITHILADLTSAITEITQLDPNAQTTDTLLNLDHQTWDILKSSDLKSAFQAKDKQKILQILESTPWHSSFKEALSYQDKYIQFGVRKIGGNEFLTLANEDNKPMKETVLPDYRGPVQFFIPDTIAVKEGKELLRLMDQNKTFRPCSLKISMKPGQSFTPECLQLLMKLKDQIAEVHIEGLEEMNFKTLALLEEEEHAFIQQLTAFTFPDLKKITLSDHAKKDWTVQDWSRLLALQPTQEFLQTCYQQCPFYQAIVIPKELSFQTTSLDVSGYPFDQLSHLLSQFPHLEHVNFSGQNFTDLQLAHLIKHHLKNSKSLQFTDCKGLTTDSLLLFGSLSELTELSLPDLPQGKLALNKLPKFENPFKIKLLYTTSKLTQPIASDFYIGPPHLAAAFQIPLARQQVPQIFKSYQRKQLDPKSVAYWLHGNDYKHLAPQKNILTILADSNAALNDQNIVEFLQKFPQVKALSLYNCPHVSATGIIHLLKACPQIKTLDLTGCRHLNESLFLEQGHMDALKQLNNLIVTDTGISASLVEVFKEEMGDKLSFEETTLTITDDDLIDDNSLEKLLKTKALHKVKRMNLENCLKLTDSMLGKLLDHLNVPLWILNRDKILVDNPQRLNLAVLNLRGCTNITDEAFDHITHTEEEEEADPQAPVKTRIEPKLLENLDRIVTGETQISAVLQQVYPQVTFQDIEEPITIQIDPVVQLQECLDYQTLEAKTSLTDEEEKTCKQLAHRYLHNRIVVDLFCKDPTVITQVRKHVIDTESDKFCDLSLSFATDDKAKSVEFPVHRDVLYSQSLYFIHGFRPGGMMSKSSGFSFINQHATPKAAQAVVDLLYGRECIEDLDWETAAHTAELVGSQNFKLVPFIYRALLHRIHSQFDLSRAENMFLVAQKLDDKEGQKEYEDTLRLWLRNLDPQDKKTFQTIANLANMYGSKQLRDQVAKIQSDKTNNLISAEMAKQNEENEKKDQQLIAKMLKDSSLGQYV